MTTDEMPVVATFEMSPTITKLVPALLKAQRMMGSATKGAVNPFHKSHYADLAEVIDTCKAPLNENGICFLQPMLTGTKGVCVKTMLIHESGEFMAATVDFPVGKLDPQEHGKASSYARRYGLMAILSMPAEDDDGIAASGKKENQFTKAMTQDFPPDTLIAGRLLKIEEPAKPGAPAKVKIEMPDSVMTFDAFQVQDEWNALAGQPVKFIYTRQGKFRVVHTMSAQGGITTSAPTNPKPKPTPPAATVAKITNGMQLACLMEAVATPGQPTTLKLALKDSDLEGTTLLKPAKLNIGQWHEANGRQVYFKTAPKDSTKIIDIMTEEAYEAAQEAAP